MEPALHSTTAASAEYHAAQEMQSARQGPGAQQLPTWAPNAHVATLLATPSIALKGTYLQGTINLGSQSSGMRLPWDTFLSLTLSPLSALPVKGSQSHPGLLKHACPI